MIGERKRSLTKKKNEERLFFPPQFFAGALLSERLEQASLSWLLGFRVGVGVVGVGTAFKPFQLKSGFIISLMS